MTQYSSILPKNRLLGDFLSRLPTLYDLRTFFEGVEPVLDKKRGLIQAFVLKKKGIY